MHKIEPWSYLRDLFCLLPSWPATKVLELAPAYWGERMAEPETRGKLEANIFRQATIAPHVAAAA